MTTCKDIMTSDPRWCSPYDTIQRVAQMMAVENVGMIPVVDGEDSKKLVGVITDRDIALKVVGEGKDGSVTKVEAIMTRDPVACGPDDDIQKALNAMAEHQIRRIPVVRNGGELAGIIAQADIATRMEQPDETAEVVEEISKSAGDK